MSENNYIKSQKSDCCLWYFFHNSCNVPVEYNDDKTYFLYFNCCSTCIEFNCNKFHFQNEGDVYLCCCFTIHFT
jgi:hypothetical protein